MMRIFAFLLFIQSALLAGSAPTEPCAIPECPCECESPCCPYYYDPCSYELFVYGEWLYWKPVTEDPMNWAQNEYVTFNLPPLGVHENRVNTLRYEFSSGFRIGAGYRIPADAFDCDTRPWQIEMVYTKLHSTNTSRIQINPGLITAGTAGTEFITPLLPI